MIEIHCTLLNKTYKVKHIVQKSIEIPNNAILHATAFTGDIDKTVYEIFITPNFILYARKSIFSR